MFNIFLRAVVFGLGVEIGREIYRAIKSKASGDRGTSTVEPRGEQKEPERDEAKPERRSSAEEDVVIGDAGNEAAEKEEEE